VKQPTDFSSPDLAWLGPTGLTALSGRFSWWPYFIPGSHTQTQRPRDLEPGSRGVRIGEDFEVLVVSDLLARIDVDKVFTTEATSTLGGLLAVAVHQSVMVVCFGRQ
jgi:hypothetical protein